MNKMKSLQRKLGIFLLALLFLLTPVSVYAADEDVSSTESNVSDAKIWKGEQITYTFSLQDYVNIKDGINVVKGTFVYDESFFGTLTESDFKMLNS